MLDFNRNEFETVLALGFKHNKWLSPNEVRLRLEGLVNQVLIANGYCTSASALGFIVEPTSPGSFFKVKITKAPCKFC